MTAPGDGPQALPRESQCDEIAEAMSSREFRQDPYPLYSRMRRDHPVYRSAEGNWYLTRHADVEGALHDLRLSNDRDRMTRALALRQGAGERVSQFTGRLGPVISNVDPPDHTRLRRLVNKAFNARRVHALRPRVQAMVDGLLDKAETPGRTMDLVASVASPLPFRVVCDLFGIPPDDRERVIAWLDELDQPITTVADRLAMLDLFERYLADLIGWRKTEPDDDVVSALIAADEDGDRLGDEELLSACFVLLTAGGATTTNLIGNGTLALLHHRDQLRRIQQYPEQIRSAVEEMVRYDTPNQMVIRVVAEELEIHGNAFMTGDLVYLVLAATNRDPQRYPDPDRLDIGRRDNRHLGFGSGLHACVGAPLSRLQGEVAIGTLARRMPALRLDVETVEWLPGPILRGPTSLRITY